MNPEEMTLEYCLGWLAENEGWLPPFSEKDNKGTWLNTKTWEVSVDNPIKPTIDSISKYMPDWWGYSISVFGLVVHARAWLETDRPLGRFVDYAIRVYIEADTELLARARLAVACRMINKE